MPHRLLKLSVTGATDPTLSQLIFGPAAIDAYQNLDNTFFSGRKVVNSTDAEAQLVLGPVANAYFLAVLSDYPVLVRLNSPTGTQFTLKAQKVPAVNVGSAPPIKCAFVLTGLVTALYLAPIPGATGVANVLVFATGDPSASYT